MRTARTVARRGRSARTPLAAALLVMLAACSGAGAGDEAGPGDEPAAASPAPASEGADDHGDGHSGHGGDHVEAPPPQPLRPGERFREVAMPAAYTPSPPYGAGTDDYRCFLLDPGVERDMMLTGIDVRPGDPDVVHHVILFQVPPERLAEAQATDREEDGQGWTCFGGAGVGSAEDGLDSVPWIGAWAPGGGEQVHEAGVGVPLRTGARIVMQVHYNLLAGTAPDTSRAVLRLAPDDGSREALETVLLPAPVELPCRPGQDDGDLCDRDAAIEDAQERFGDFEGQFGNFLHLFCGPIDAGDVQSCTRKAQHDMTVRAAAGHMHLLGRKISIEAAGRTVLDIPVWNFDDQGSEPVPPLKVRRGQELTVTCRHDQSLRDQLPAFEGQEERYVVWGEGTTDEMCLGILLVTRP